MPWENSDFMFLSDHQAILGSYNCLTATMWGWAGAIFYTLGMLSLVYLTPPNFPLPVSLPTSYIYFACVTLIGSCFQHAFHLCILASHHVLYVCFGSFKNILVPFPPPSWLKSENEVAMHSVCKKLDQRQPRANSPIQSKISGNP